jgi:sugar/nucleoside kinase (ribokinase family)
MVGVRKLGLSCSYIGRFGSDAAGDIGFNSLVDANVDMRYAERIDGARTQIAFIVIDQRTGERTVIWQRDARLHYNESEAPDAPVLNAKVLHLSPHDTRECIRLARLARSNGVIVSADIDRAFDGIDELLPNVDILITSSEFPRQFMGIDNATQALGEMHRRFGAGVVGITLGEEGSVLLCDGETIRTPGFDVPGGCKDTTGAGDSFRVGLLYGLIAGKSVEESARMANAVAALKCRAVGARTSLPNRDELEAFLK